MDGGLCCPAPLGSALAAAEVYLDAAKANAVGRVGGCIDRGEDPPSSALPFDDFIPSFSEAHQVEVEPRPHWSGDDHRLGETPHVEHRLGLFLLHNQIPYLKLQIDNLIVPSRGVQSIKLAIRLIESLK